MKKTIMIMTFVFSALVMASQKHVSADMITLLQNEEVQSYLNLEGSGSLFAVEYLFTARYNLITHVYTGRSWEKCKKTVTVGDCLTNRERTKVVLGEGISCE